jgi:glycosyltransferase involved in cell wall biosynthesis
MAEIPLPFFSVVIPTYNCAPLLKKALESVMAQTFPRWEAIIVNNFSDDDTEEVVQVFREPRFTLVNFRNGGVIAASRNVGIREAKGEFAAFLDADDTWYPEKLGKVYELLCGEKKLDVVYHDMQEVKEGKALLKKVGRQLRKPCYDDLLYGGNTLTTSATTVRLELARRLEGFSESREFITAEDYEFWLRLAREGAEFRYLPQVMGEYLRVPNSMSSKIDYHFTIALNVRNHHIESQAAERRYPPGYVKKRKREIIGQNHYSRARAYFYEGLFRESRVHYWKAIRCHPLQWKPYAGLFQLLFSRSSPGGR